MKYSLGFRASIIRKTLDGSGRSVYQIARETGVNYTTLTGWIEQHKAGKLSLDGCDAVTPDQRNPGEKLALLLEGKAMAEDGRGEWLRQHGLHSEHLPLWEQELTSIMKDKQTDMRNDNANLRKENKRLQKENERQKKALAEAAILLTLKKKFQNLFVEDEED
jgi:transposase